MNLRQTVRSLTVTCLLVAGAFALSGCVVAPIGPGWYYGHPYRWR